jgi:23S rRNA (adenine2030-N6)-methyltransferase
VLSYQHAYHAGNAADCHKHLALVLLLRRLQQKETPLCFVDSHAGRGLYDLASAEARKTNDAAGGIRRLAEAPDPPAPVRDYLDLVRAHNGPDELRYYPGSAVLAQQLLRDDDRAILLELHPQEFHALRVAIGRDPRVYVHERDCQEGLSALLPPKAPIRRGLVLIDPSYEVKEEYETSVTLLGRALERFGTGVFLLWYPLLAEERHLRLKRLLEELGPPKTLISEYRFSDKLVGLQGSGLAIVNAPWQIDEALGRAMGYVAAALDAGGKSRHELRWLTGTA